MRLLCPLPDEFVSRERFVKVHHAQEAAGERAKEEATIHRPHWLLLRRAKDIPARADVKPRIVKAASISLSNHARQPRAEGVCNKSRGVQSRAAVQVDHERPWPPRAVDEDQRPVQATIDGNEKPVGAKDARRATEATLPTLFRQKGQPPAWQSPCVVLTPIQHVRVGRTRCLFLNASFRFRV